MSELPFRIARVMAILLATLIVVPFYLPPLRGAIDGESYGWGVMIFARQLSGYGTGGDYALLLALSGAAWASLVALWRAPRRLAGRLSAVWFAVFAASAVSEAMIHGPVVMEGDTLDVSLDLTWIYVGAPLAALLAALLLAVGPDAPAPRWTSRNTAFTLLALAVFAAAGLLLAVGEPHAATDEWGVLALLANLFVLQGALAGWPPRPRSGRVSAAMV